MTQKHIAHVKFIAFSVHQRVIILINCCQLYEIKVSEFMQQLSN